MKLRFAISVVALACLCTVRPAGAQFGRGFSNNLRDGRDVRAAFKPVVANADAATVRILCDGKDAVLGTVVGSDGWIVTKYSELRDPVVCKFFGGRQLPATMVGCDPQYDLAMLKVDATDLKTVDWAEEKDGPAVGQLLATASPGELPVAIGVVSVPLRTIPPLPGRLGIRFGEQARIQQVFSGSPAEQAGLKADDVVLEANGKHVDSTDAATDLIHQLKPGDRLDLLIERGDNQIQITATMKRPEDVGPLTRIDRMNEMGGPLSFRSFNFPSVIQHDTVLRPTECGGPLVDLNGKVVGINIARAGRTESYAVPAEKVEQMLADLESGRMAPKEALAGTKEKKTEATSK